MNCWGEPGSIFMAISSGRLLLGSLFHKPKCCWTSLLLGQTTDSCSAHCPLASSLKLLPSPQLPAFVTARGGSSLLRGKTAFVLIELLMVPDGLFLHSSFWMAALSSVILMLFVIICKFESTHSCHLLQVIDKTHETGQVICVYVCVPVLYVLYVCACIACMYVCIHACIS